VVPFALIPLAVTWFGFSIWGKVFLVAWAVFFIAVVGVSSAVASIDPLQRKAAEMLRLRWLHRVFWVTLPAVLPDLVVTARIGVGVAWVAMVAAEYLGSTSGLGYLIIQAQQVLDSTTILAGMVVIGVVGAAMAAAIAKLGSVLVGDRGFRQ
jgi:ABC-type nitrate/sulfonate/bicarbonate transport system permease component